MGNVTERGQFRVTQVKAVEFRTSLKRRGFWVGDRQVIGTAQRSFSSDAAFRRFAMEYSREHFNRS